eukprot:TRINITY_DN18430_c0_g1_i2.p1 TRINITY_DN18430_c0_g1~~TRINITY_DN18430_c0_g1_i2.p1  ORF type:complete len:775 (+),score=154.93 TRINITY_DN18430_c0_g1_i2:30-2354(+)
MCAARAEKSGTRVLKDWERAANLQQRQSRFEKRRQRWSDSLEKITTDIPVARGLPVDANEKGRSRTSTSSWHDAHIQELFKEMDVTGCGILGIDQLHQSFMKLQIPMDDATFAQYASRLLPRHAEFVDRTQFLDFHKQVWGNQPVSIRQCAGDPDTLGFFTCSTSPRLRRSHSMPFSLGLKDLRTSETMLRSAYSRHSESHSSSSSKLPGCLMRKQLPALFQEVGLDSPAVPRLRSFLDKEFTGYAHTEDTVTIHDAVALHNRYVAELGKESRTAKAAQTKRQGLSLLSSTAKQEALDRALAPKREEFVAYLVEEIEGSRPPLQIGADLGALQMEGFNKYPPSFYWVRKANTPQHRALRRAAAEQTLMAISAQGYSLLGDPVQQLSTDAMVKGTRIISADEADFRTSESACSGTKLRHMLGTVYEVAAERAREGVAVLAVNAASAYHVGGGFSSGGRHALEESMCMQSTLFASLQKAEELATARASTHPAEYQAAHAKPPAQHDGQPWHRHVPIGGAILSPSVELFRGGTNDGYPFWETPVKLAGVASIAMFNLNERVRDSPVDAPPDREEYMTALRKTFCSVFAAADACGAATVVLPDAGCGVFRNKPEDVGRALGEVLTVHTWPTITEVIVCSRRDFFAAVKASATGIEELKREMSRKDTGLERREAAAKIQSSFRGKRDRKTYPENHEEGTEISDNLCKFGCGAPVAQGRSRSGRPFDTCCRECARSRGSGRHSRGCPGYPKEDAEADVVEGSPTEYSTMVSAEEAEVKEE